MNEPTSAVARPDGPDLQPPPGLHPFESVVLSVPLLHGLSFVQPPLCVRCGAKADPSQTLSRDFRLGEGPETDQVFLETVFGNRSRQWSRGSRGGIHFPLCRDCLRSETKISLFSKILGAIVLLTLLAFWWESLEIGIVLLIIGLAFVLIGTPLLRWKRASKKGRSPEVGNSASGSLLIFLYNSHFALRFCQLNRLPPMSVMEGDTVAALLAASPELDLEESSVDEAPEREEKTDADESPEREAKTDVPAPLDPPWRDFEPGRSIFKDWRVIALMGLGGLAFAYAGREPIFFMIGLVAFLGKGLNDPDLFRLSCGCFFVFVVAPLALMAYFRWDNSRRIEPDDWRKIR